MTDLYAEIEENCGYEISKIYDAFEDLPSFTSDAQKAEIVKDVFTSNGGGVGWDVTGSEQIEIDKDGARLYRLINGTSGDTKTLQQYSFLQLMRLISDRLDTSSELPSEKEVFAVVVDDFAKRCKDMSYYQILEKWKGQEPHGGSYHKDWQIAHWANSVAISVPFRKCGELEFMEYRFTYEKIAKAVVSQRDLYTENRNGQLSFKI